MQTVMGQRAASILYDVLCSRGSGEVFLMPANICPIVPITFFKAGMQVEFVDIEPISLAMDLEQIEQRLGTRRYGGILYAHTYGDPTTPADFFEGVKGRWPSLLLIDDRCLCSPELDADPRTPFDVTLFSTGYGKVVDLGSMGYAFVHDGLAFPHRSLTFRDRDLAELESAYKFAVACSAAFAYQDTDWLQTDGTPAAWREFAARLRQAREDSLAHRRAINAVYNLLIPADLRLPERFQLWRYNVRLPRKAAALKAVFAAGLFASSHYASLVGIMGKGTGHVAKDLADSTVNLFNDSHYTVEMAEETARIVLGRS
jgi:hypothetical protein